MSTAVLPPPVRVADVPAAVGTLLRAADFPDAGRLTIYVEQERPENPLEDFQSEVVVFLPQRVYSAPVPWMPMDNPFRQDVVRCSVVASAADDPEGLAGFDYLGRVQDLQEVVHRTLHWQPLTLPGHECVLPLRFLGYVNHTAMFDARRRAWCISAEYTTVLRRVA